MEPERLDRGLVLILPGIEGRSFLNVSLMAGLLDAGLPYAMEIVDWTTGCFLLAIYHLRAWQRNRRVARQIASRVVEYRRQYPGRPVWLIGHSAGGAMSLLTAEFLSAGQSLTGIVLLAPAISSRYSCDAAMQRTERGIWNFYSAGDVWFLGLGTLLFGTFDGVHWPASGCIGFAHRTDPRSSRRVPIAADPLSLGNDLAVQPRRPLRLRASRLRGRNDRADLARGLQSPACFCYA